MTLAELITEVYSITGRPDRVAETLSAVKSATLKAHQSDYYYKDIFETGVAFDAADYIQALDYRSLLSNWRALKYLRKYDAAANTPGRMLKIISPDELFDGYKIQKADICYVAGAYIQINSSTPEQTYLLGCYLNPVVTDTGYNSWIALDHPYAIVYDAAATVFKAVGKDEESAQFRQLVADQLKLLQMSNVVSEGF